MNTLAFMLALAALLSFVSGFRAIRNSRSLPYFRLRRSRLLAGWRLLFLGLIIVAVTLLVFTYGEPVAYRFYTVTAMPSPTPSITPTPTITPTFTISPTPTITPTLSETYTPTPTSTPHIPVAVELQFSGVVTPPADAAFSPLRFAQGIDKAYNPINPDTRFANPVGHMYAIFSYDKMLDGVQWTALWYRNGELVYFETLAWNGGTGGFGYSDWEPSSDEWLPGSYEVQIFIGLVVKQAGVFEVVGDPPTATPVPSATPTFTPSITPTPSLTPTITLTPTNTYTPSPTITLWPTKTPTITPTRFPTRVPPTIPPTITPTRVPSPTPQTTSPPGFISWDFPLMA